MSHERMKPKAKAIASGEEGRHVQRIAGIPCLICQRPANVHHGMHASGKVRRRDHRFIVPLCRDHHQGDEGVHGLGSESKFRERWGVDLVAWAIHAWESRETY